MPRIIRFWFDFSMVWLALLAAVAGSGFLAGAVGPGAVIGWLAAMVVVLVGYFRRRPGRRWAKSVEDERAHGVFVGGCQWHWMVRTWPLVRLTVSRDGIEVRPTWRLLRLPPFKFSSPPPQSSWVEIKQVQRVKTAFSDNSAVAFDLEGGTLFFGLSGTANDILQAVRERAPDRVAPGYRRRWNRL